MPAARLASALLPRPAARAARLLLTLGVLLVAATVSVSAATPASACSCAVAGDRAALANATLVLTGTLVSVDGADAAGGSSTDPVHLTFTVDRVLKGTLSDPARARQVVDTAVSGASCGAELSADHRYLVFAAGDAAGGYSTTLCSGNREITAAQASGGLAGLPPGTPAAPAPTSLSPATVAGQVAAGTTAAGAVAGSGGAGRPLVVAVVLAALLGAGAALVVLRRRRAVRGAV